jgi:WD40 repeat protein
MVLNGHVDTDFIWSIVVIDEIRICSRSNDKKIKVWNVITGVCETNFDGHTDAINDMVLLSDGRLCSISSDGNVNIWNTYTGICDCSVRIGIRTSIYGLIQLLDGRVMISSLSGLVAYVLGD